MTTPISNLHHVDILYAKLQSSFNEDFVEHPLASSFQMCPVSSIFQEKINELSVYLNDENFLSSDFSLRKRGAYIFQIVASSLNLLIGIVEFIAASILYIMSRTIVRIPGFSEELRGLQLNILKYNNEIILNIMMQGYLIFSQIVISYHTVNSAISQIKKLAACIIASEMFFFLVILIVISKFYH